jgi:hypothetical protein
MITSPYPEISSPFTGIARPYPEFAFSPPLSPHAGDENEIRSASAASEEEEFRFVDEYEHERLIPSTSDALHPAFDEPTARQPWTALLRAVAWPIIIPNSLVWLNEGMVIVMLPLAGAHLGCSEHTIGVLAAGAQFGRVAGNPLAGMQPTFPTLRSLQTPQTPKP